MYRALNTSAIDVIGITNDALRGAEMGEHEEVHDEDVIVVIMNEDGAETYYREEMIIPINNERFAVLVALSADSEDELDGAEEEDEAIIAKILVDENGEDVYVDPSDEEFAAVLSAYERLDASGES